MWGRKIPMLKIQSCISCNSQLPTALNYLQDCLSLAHSSVLIGSVGRLMHLNTSYLHHVFMKHDKTQEIFTRVFRKVLQIERRSGFLWVKGWWTIVSNRVCHMLIADCTIHSTISFRLLASACEHHLKGHLQLAFPPYFRCPQRIPRSFVKSSPESVLAAGWSSFASAVVRCGHLDLASCS